MADFEAPSFSLGLDLETQSELRVPSPVSSAHHDDSSDIGRLRANEVEQGEVMDSDPESGPESARVLKRLRRGFGRPAPSPTCPSSSLKTRELDRSSSIGNGDDDIEEFSSQEDLLVGDEHQSAKCSSVGSNSKFRFRGRGVLTAQPSSLSQARKIEQASDAPSSASMDTSHFGLMFPKLTVSPLRRFQLIDSDSDTDLPAVSENVKKGAKTIKLSTKESELTAPGEKRQVSGERPRNEDLWKDFRPVKRFQIPTPVLDEVCEEYFQSARDKNATPTVMSVGNRNEFHTTTTSTSKIFEQCWDSADPRPPAHRYFLHDDPRIQNLVRSRLPNFSPLGVVANRGNQQPAAPVINYMSQFSNGEASKSKGTQKMNSKKISSRGRNKSNKSNASEGWVDPKSNSAVPKDAGKRRVHAASQSAGHWFTSPEGRKVYVSRSGQEMLGQFAYRQYRKESGAGSRKSKNKTSTKRKRTKN